MVALLMLVLGAVQYVASAAMPSTRVAARGRMTNAVLGLLLLFGTYVILNTINPELVMPGLGLSGTMGTENLTIPGGDTAKLSGVILYNTEDCSDGGRRYFFSQSTLNHGTDDEWSNKAVAFEIFRMDDKVQFFREGNFMGEASFEIPGPRSCTKFADYEKEDLATSDFAKDVSSFKFIPDMDGVNLCSSEQPSEKTCVFFDASPGLQPSLMQNVRLGDTEQIIPPVPPTTLTFYTPNYYDLWQGGDNPYSPVEDKKAKWIDVPGGKYAILGTAADPANAYFFFILESSVLKYWGDLGPLGACLNKTTSFLMIKGYKDKYHSENSDSDICKGVIFYTGKDFDRYKFWGMNEEAAGFPIGWGDLSQSKSVNLTTHEYNFTQVDDVGKFGNLIIGSGLFDAYNISSLRLLGNCKLKIVEHGNDCGGASCEDVFCGHSINDLEPICQPMSEICSCIVPKGNTTCSCSGGTCAGAIIPVVPLAPPCNKDEGCPVAKCCVGTNWDEDIESFILCNKDDDEPPCDFNCTF